MTAAAQITIDATGPYKEPRESSGGQHGSMGRRLALQVAVEVHGGPSGDDGKTVVEFVLTNSGKEGLSIPVSPDPGEVEPAEGNYRLKVLVLYMRSCSSPSEWPCAIARQRELLPGGAWLYGNEESATLVTLAPGDSIRVRTKVKLPPVLGTGHKKTEVFVAHARLVGQTVTTVDGKTLRDTTEDLGSANSPEYTLEALLNSEVRSLPQKKKEKEQEEKRQ